MPSKQNNHPISTIAKLLNISERRVQQLAKDGIIPKGQRGEYDLVGCVRGYAIYLQNQLTQNDYKDLKQEKTRLVKFQADKTEIELQVIQKNAVLVSDVEKEVANMFSIIRGKLLALPSKLAPIVSVENDVNVVENIIKDGVCEVLSELSAMKLKVEN